VRILVTGSRGFIGGSLGRHAVVAGNEVLGISRSSQPAANWSGQYIQADVTSADLSVIIGDFAPDLLIHAAGTASVGASFVAPSDDLRATVLTWANVLESVRRSSRKPLLLFPSSAAVYGNPAGLPVSEEMPTQPISPYGFHKAMCEMVAREYAEFFGLDIIICRLFSVFGVEQRRLLVRELYEQLASDEAIVWLNGTGMESRDYLDIEDVAVAFLQVADQCRKEEQAGGRCLIVNVGSGQETSVLELAQMMRGLIAPEKEIRCRGIVRAGDPRRWQADVSRLRKLAPAWRPHSLAESLSQCVAGWQKGLNA
jgi:UDP-glucose 4-epimerase